MAKPIIDTVHIDPQLFFVALGDRVKKPQTFYISTIPTIALIGYNDVIEGTFFCPTAGQPDTDHG